MSLAHWAAAHRRSILFLTVLLAVGGAITAFKLPIALFPQVDFPRVVVSLEAGDRPADQMVIAVTEIVERAVRAVPGVVGIRSTTSRGSAELSINFAWRQDMVAATLQVESAVNQSLPTLPPGTAFSVRRMDPTVFPVLAYSMVSHTVSPVALRDIGVYQLIPLLSSIEGVATVQVIGGEDREYRVEVAPDKLAAHGISLDELALALSATNVLQAVGRLEDNYKLYLLLSDTRIRSLQEIEDTVVRSGVDGNVRLSDLASIYPASVPQWQRVSADGKPAVLFQIYQQPDGNAVNIGRDVEAKLAAYAGNLPAEVTLSKWYDQSELIIESARSVRDAIAVGVLLAAAVLLVFLRSVRITVVAIVVVPTVLAATMLLLELFGMSLNIMTLGGMAAAVGLVVDDTIVMIEHLVRRQQEDGGVRTATIRRAAAEFTAPLAGSSAATIVIFAPLAFLTGVTGAFFKALSITMASALAISFVIAWLLVPLLAEHIPVTNTHGPRPAGRLARVGARAYRRLMHALLARPVLVVVPLLVLAGAGWLAYQQVGSGFIPVMDEGGFVLDYRSPSGTSLTETARLLGQVETILTRHPAVATFSRRTGVQLGGGLTEANAGDFFVRLKPLPRAPLEAVIDELRQTIEDKVPLLEIEMVLLMEDVIGDLTAVPQPVEIKLYGDDIGQLMSVAPAVADLVKTISGTVDVKDGIVLAGDAVSIVVDRDKAALEGIEPQAVTRLVDAWFTGLVPTQVQEPLKLVGVRVWIPGEARRYADQIGDMLLQAPDGHRFPLRRIASITTESGQPQVSRDNLKQMIAVTARISDRDMGSTVREVRQKLDASGVLGKGMYYELGGLYQQQQIAFRGLLAVGAAALALVFVLLLGMYESFRVAIAILSCPLLAMSAVFGGLWVSGIDLNITALMGMTMIIGIVTEIAIFYFSEFHELRENGASFDEAVMQAGLNRIRPITMTTLAAILALTPLALALGQGAAMQQPLAVAIIAGLAIQIPLVLVTMPTLFALLGGRVQAAPAG